jgi:SAM-dependent methyltransferase
MGKLQDLVKYKNKLLSLSKDIDMTDIIKDSILTIELASDDKIMALDKIINSYRQLSIDYQQINSSINQTLDDIDIAINEQVSKLSSDDKYQLLCEISVFRHLIMTNEIERQLDSKISSLSDLRYPTLQINPKEKRWIDCMVAGDPLYLVGPKLKIINNLINLYPDLYQSRLRLYEIKDIDFSILPTAQFGFVLCWDNFNYLSFDKIKQYVKEVFTLLRPGGKFIFSYNNCDIETSVGNFEDFFAGWCTTKLLTDLFDEIGYELVEFKNIKVDESTQYISWVEIKKPGNLKTVKLSQSIAQLAEK